MNITRTQVRPRLPQSRPTPPPAEKAPKDDAQWVSNLKDSAGPALMSLTAAGTTQLGPMGALASPLLSTGNYTLGAVRLLDAYRTVNDKPIDGSKGPIAVAAGALGFAAGMTGLIASIHTGSALPLLAVQVPALAANIAAGIMDPQS